MPSKRPGSKKSPIMGGRGGGVAGGGKVKVNLGSKKAKSMGKKALKDKKVRDDIEKVGTEKQGDKELKRLEMQRRQKQKNEKPEFSEAEEHRIDKAIHADYLKQKILREKSRLKVIKGGKK